MINSWAKIFKFLAFSCLLYKKLTFLWKQYYFYENIFRRFLNIKMLFHFLDQNFKPLGPLLGWVWGLKSSLILQRFRLFLRIRSAKTHTTTVKSQSVSNILKIGRYCNNDNHYDETQHLCYRMSWTSNFDL